jgi:hypothetical protein
MELGSVTLLLQKMYLIEADILTGCAKGEKIFLPKILLYPNDFPVKFRRVQFPIKVCFATIINKAQG